MANDARHLTLVQFNKIMEAADALQGWCINNYEDGMTPLVRVVYNAGGDGWFITVNDKPIWSNKQGPLKHNPWLLLAPERLIALWGSHLGFMLSPFGGVIPDPFEGLNDRN